MCLMSQSQYNFLYMASKAQVTTKKINKLDFMNFFLIHVPKDTREQERYP
jgi:hypothetical protein